MAHAINPNPDPQRWRRVEEICDAALHLGAAERDAYLAAACGADEALRREVDALLVHEKASSEFLSAPVGAIAAQVLEPPRHLIGTRIADYDIVGKLGEGGMGEVYRARDRKLGRDVAIKVLPAAVANDQERLKRFEREARLLASVNHPSIGAIYGLVEAAGVRALVLELLEGETLADALKRGPLKLDRALAVAAQICDALDHAHRRGVTHRDLKPSNIMLSEGKVKVLDFGVGKQASGAAMTRESTLTNEGAIVGTLHYMAPEQLEGQATDARSDIFSLGAVLYEMVAGRKAFDGPSQASIIAAVLEAPTPKLTGIGGTLAPRLERVVTKCLSKRPDDRWQSTRDLGDELRWLGAEMVSMPNATTPHSSKPRRRLAIVAGLAAVAAVLLAGWIASWRTQDTSPAAAVRFSVQPQDARLEPAVFDLSHDGQLLYGSTAPGRGRLLHVRRLDSFDTVTVPGREGAFGHVFSPDGEWVAFVARRTLRKIKVGAEAAPIILLEDLDPAIEITWPVADTILIVGRNQPVRRVPANGGLPEAITTLQPGEVDHHGAELLPSGKALLFAVHGKRNRFSIAAQDLRSGARKTLIESGFAPRYSPTGHLVFGKGSALMAVPFDEARLEVLGDPVVLVEHVSNEARSGALDFRLSKTGTLAYIPEPQTDGRLLTWVDRSGRETAVALPARSFETPRVSPDGNHLAFVVRGVSGQREVWTVELASGRLARVTEDGDNWGPLWTRDGDGLLYSSDTGASSGIVRYHFDGAARETLGTSDNDLWATAVADDGRVLVTVQPPTDEMYLAQLVAGSLAPQLLLKKPGAPRFARLSPDGEWLTYSEAVSGRTEVFIQGYPDAGIRRQVSIDGGSGAVWSRDGKELFFRSGNRMLAVSIDTKSGLQWGRPRLLFQADYGASPIDYDVAQDSRFLMVKPAPAEGAPGQINVIVNWHGELLARVPVRR